MPIIEKATRSLMATGAMFWGGASYNNGLLPFKNYILGEAYTSQGQAASISGPVLPDPQTAMMEHGILPSLLPLPAWETSVPADALRVFERGGVTAGNRFPETGLPNLGGLQQLGAPGHPDIHQSNRAPGTGGRVAIPLLNLQKSRLNDPMMWFLGTNDQPGDYRSSGCASCHVVYANDRDPKHSGPTRSSATRGNHKPSILRSIGTSPGIRSQHRFTRAIPTSQCMVCHMHQPNMFMNTFMGYTMWDYEADAPAMWPEKQRYPTTRRDAAVNEAQSRRRGAESGKWADRTSSAHVTQLNSQAAGHAVRRLPRSRLEFPRRLQARSQRQSARRQRQPVARR